MTSESHFTYYKQFYFLYLKNTAYIMYGANYSGLTSLREQLFLLSYSTGSTVI